MPGAAAKRSPTSFCTIATQRVTAGSSSIVRRIALAAIPYGRLATTFVGGGSSAARSSAIASARCSVALASGSSASRSAGSSAAVDLDDVHVRDARREVLREHAEPAADLQHDVVGRELGGARDHAEDVRVDQEVLAELAVRAHAELRRRRRLGCDGQGPAGPRLTTRTASAALRSTGASSSS